jgi:hypothetical protein
MNRQRLAAVMILWSMAPGVWADDNQDFAARGKPGAEHERLQALVGKWDLTLEGGSGKGTAEFKSIMGGRFVTEEVKLPFGGLTMEWLGIYGYDKQRKKYTAVWVDNMDTTTETGEGEADAAGKVLTFKGEHIDPRTSKPARFTWRITREGDSKLLIEMFEPDPAGKDRKVMAIHGEKAR